MSGKEENKGYDTDTIAVYRARMNAEGRNFLFDDKDEQTEEYAHFYFIGTFDSKEVIYDTAIYTLRLNHESELYEAAEARALKQFPQYKKIAIEDEESDSAPDPMEEEVGMFMAEVIMELEEEEAIKVREHVDQDVHVPFGISLDVGLHVEKVTPQVIVKFIKDFNEDNLSLDETMYSFQAHDQETD